MRTLSYLSILTSLVTLVTSTPYEGFPFNEQLPTVARVDEPYSFQISNETYLSSVGTVTYTAEDLPNWLSFDSDSRTLSGTPSSSDVSTNVTFTLIGTDSESSLNVTQNLVVSDSTGPTTSDVYTVLSQLADFGQTNGLNGLVLSPGEVFNITFDSRTFTSDDSIVAYYGRSSDRTPLPNWLFFDSSNLRFSGVAPAVNSEIAPGFSYSFILVASDYAGFSGEDVEFYIIVGAHELTTTLKDTIHINGSAGDVLDYELPLESVYSDGQEISSANISNIALNGAPDWLSLENYALVGTVPDDYTSSNTTFNVTIYDLYSNSVTLFFEIQSISSLFSISSYRDANATRGDYFQYYFLPSDFTDYSSTNISVEIDDSNDWLTFHKSNLTINGETPEDFDEAKITVIASSSKLENELSFEIYGVDPITTSSSSSHSSSHSSHSSHSSGSSSTGSSSSSLATATSSSSAIATSTTTTTNKTSGSSSNKSLAIGLGVGIPVFALLVAGILLFLCCFKRRKNTVDDEKDEKEGYTPKISKPILGNPANGPNSRSPNGFQTPSGQSPEKNGDWTEPQRLSALNVLKLDEKDYFDSDSDGSSSTNVGSFDSLHDDTHSSLYQDALQAQSTDMLMTNTASRDPIPKRSWRQTIDSKINRESLNSLATVSTNELLSIRLAEDDDIYRDPRKSSLGFRDSVFLGSTASSILTRDDSGNLQKLDSDGNIAGTARDTRQRVSRATDLDILQEELSPRLPQGIDHDTSFSSANTSGGEEFFPVNTESGTVQWKQQERSKFTFESDPDKNTITQHKNNSKARLMDFTDRARADTSNDITQSTGETAEIESL